MSRPILAICDPDSVYLRRLDEYIRNHINLSIDIHSFSDRLIMDKFAETEDVNLLIASEKSYYELWDAKALDKYRNILVLDEEGFSGAVAEADPTGRHVEHISKYQPASGIAHAVIDMCSRSPEDFRGLWARSKVGNSRIIGFYTPLSRCGQTSMAIKAGEILARKGKTILLSFETYSSMGGLLKEEPEEDITDLLYYADCEKDKFCLYLERIKKSSGELDFIAPAKTAMQIKDVTCERLSELTQLLTREAGYEFILIDMKEYPEGFDDILRMCSCIFTVNRAQPSDKYRMRMFENVLSRNGCEDIQQSLVKCSLPDIREKAAYTGAIEELLGREGLINGSAS
ncbi:hypothetical protein [Butyrivibrio sp. MC2021]|uniref:hypothetical protein n=1 Tax=Butyrivibrio sp. MC2021 TaxID=1408306 RepID=UPI00047E16EF|nr:hypothetical protein [Butyrivibrio sp. MC2021]